MNQFLDSIDSYIFILNKKLEIIFCNKKLLNKLECSESEIDKIQVTSDNKIDDKSISYKISGIKKDEVLNLDLILYMRDRKFKLKSKITNGYFYSKDVVFVSSDNIEIIDHNLQFENNTIEENTKQEIQGTEKSISTLICLLKKIEQSTPIEEIFKDIDIKQSIEQILSEIHKTKLMKKDFELLLEISADIVGVMDNNGYLKTVGQNWTSYLGWSEQEILESNILNLVHESHKDKLSEILNSDNKDVVVIENKIICKNNKYKWFRWNLKLVKEKSVFAFTARDITKEKEQEKQRKKLEETVHLESIKNEFFANMSHEFKTPLNIILGTIQLIDRNINDENIFWNENTDLSRHVKLIRQNSYRLLRLVNNLIDMTRINNGYYELKLVNHDIVNIVEEITLSVAQYIEGKEIELIFDTNCEEKIIACDPEKIERILLNLLSNSIKYTNKNGNIYVDLQVDEEKINISVRDDGEGISKDKLPIIFNRFVQDDKKLTKNCEGSGIGLSLVKSLVEMHGGKITVYSTKGVGTNFEFYLPNKATHCETNEINKNYICDNNKIEMCNIEFSDIYGM